MKTADGELQKADRRWDVGDHAGAERIMRRFVKRHSEEPRGWVWLTEVERRDNPEKALATIAQAFERFPDDPMVRASLGTTLVETNRSDPAVEILTELIEEAPGLDFAYEGLVGAAWKQGRFDDVVAIARAAQRESRPLTSPIAARIARYVAATPGEESLALAIELLEYRMADEPSSDAALLLGLVYELHGQPSAEMMRMARDMWPSGSIPFEERRAIWRRDLLGAHAGEAS